MGRRTPASVARRAGAPGGRGAPAEIEREPSTFRREREGRRSRIARVWTLPVRVRHPRALAAVALGALVLFSGTPESRAAARDTRRVLFIGNSYTRFNDLPRMVAALSRSAPRGAQLRTARETRGGFSLRMHWRSRRLRQRIGSRRYDAVVLQEHSLAALNAPEEMAEYTRRFSREVSRAGARLVLFQTWARHPRSRIYARLALASQDEMLARIEAFYQSLAQELHASVAPVGRAWRRAFDLLPGIELHRRDGTHPAPAGTYLSACVLYGTLTGVDPREASWRPWPMRADEAARIRAIAAESLGYR